MTFTSPNPTTPVMHTHMLADESTASGINWSAIIGGGIAATSLSLVLMVLGSALGLTAMAPWSSNTAAGFTMKAATWLIFTQWTASAIGGYIAGRLRVKWVRIHDDEMFFRDTAHGFLTWALATLLTATILAAGIATVMGIGAKSAAMAAGMMASAPAHPANGAPMDHMMDPMAYYTDMLFRPANVAAANTQGSGISMEGQSAAPAANAPTETQPMPIAPPAPPMQMEQRGEATRILMQGMKNGALPDGDKTYLSQIVAARTGLSQSDASKRVDDVFAQMNGAKDEAKQKAEEARKTAMHVSLYIAFSMLVGAFIASFSATLGGRLRDEYHAEYHATNK